MILGWFFKVKIIFLRRLFKGYFRGYDLGFGENFREAFGIDF